LSAEFRTLHIPNLIRDSMIRDGNEGSHWWEIIAIIRKSTLFYIIYFYSQ